MRFARLPLKRLGDVYLGKMIQPEPKGPSDVAASYLRAAHVQPNGRLVDVDDKKMWFRDNELELHGLLADDVVIVEGGAGYGRSAVLREDRSGWGFQNSIVRVRPRRSLASGRFIDYALQSALAAGEIEVACFTATIPHFTADKVGAFRVPAPPVDEQRVIAEYLDRETARIDTLIEEQRRLIEMLRERRAALIARETGWGSDRPEGWTMMRLSWLFEATGSGTTPANEDITYGEDADVPWVTTGELRESVVLKTARGVGVDVIDRYSALKVHPAGSLLIAMYGATIGRMGLLGRDATSNQACCALIGPTLALAEFVQYSLLAAKNMLLLEAAGGGQPNINQEKIRSFRIPVPPLPEQAEACKHLEEKIGQIDQLIAETERFIELSRERRAALITAAVTGQIDVREVA